MVCHEEEGCHLIFSKTLVRVRQNFWLDQMTKAVYYYVQACLSCQQNKKYKLPLTRQLQPITPSAPMELWGWMWFDCCPRRN